MKNNSFLNAVVILFLCGIVLLYVKVIKTIDLTNRQINEIHDCIVSLSGRIDSMESGIRYSYGAFAQSGEMVANQEFYAKDAVSGGKLRLATSFDVDNMNMLISPGGGGWDFWELVNDPLAKRNWNKMDTFQPMLAESWTISEDKLRYHFKLRKGVLWHDFIDPVTKKQWRDIEVTAHDFKFYFDVIMDEKVDASGFRSQLSGIDRIEVVNDYEFDVVWKDIYFMSNDVTFGLFPLPRHLYHAYQEPFDGARFNDDHLRNSILIGCGAYKFKSHTVGQEYTFERFEKYWGNQYGIRPPIKEITYEVIQHPSTRIQALKGNMLDMIEIDPEAWMNLSLSEDFSESGNLSVLSYPSWRFSYIGLNLRNSIFSDKRTRQALNYAINRDALIQNIYKGMAKAVSGPFCVSSPDYDNSIPPYEYDLNKARKLLQEAGWRDSDDGILENGNGEKLRFSIMYSGDRDAASRILPGIQESMSKIGVKLELISLEFPVLIQRAFEGKFDAVILSWSTPFLMDTYNLWHSSLIGKTNSNNYVCFNNPQADSLMERVRKTSDENERIRLSHQLHRLYYEESPYLFLFSIHNITLYNKRLKNVRLFPDGIHNEIIWIDDEKMQEKQKDSTSKYP